MLNERVVRIEALDMDGTLLEGARFKVYIDSTLCTETEKGNGFITVQIDQPGADISVEAFYDKYHHGVRIAGNADVVPIEFPEVKYVSNDQKAENIAFYFGIVFTLLGVLLAVFIPEPTKYQARIFTGFF